VSGEFAGDGAASDPREDEALLDNLPDLNGAEFWRSSSAASTFTGRYGGDLLGSPHPRSHRTGIERYKQTLARERALGQCYRDLNARATALPVWLSHYNTARNHSSLSNRPPISRVREPAEPQQLAGDGAVGHESVE
jgi:hypothetical protein